MAVSDIMLCQHEVIVFLVKENRSAGVPVGDFFMGTKMPAWVPAVSDSGETI